MAKEVNKRINVWLNQQGIENNLKSIKAAISKTANELNKLPIGSEEWLRKSKKLSELKNIYSEVRKEIGATEQELKAVNEQFNKNIVNAGAIGSIYAGASTAIQRLVSSTQEYVDAYATLDDAMTNVSKYTGLTREEVKQLNEEFRKMDTRTPTEKLNALAADAGRLGITSKEAIKDFVEAADIINVALGEDLGEDAVKEIGKLAEMFGTTETMGLRGAMLATGSAINTLAQSSSASERYLMDFTSRLAGAANQAQISQANILGFASVLDQNKQQVEMSATALQKLLMNMFTAPEKYAHLAGMSVKEFADALKNDANEALITFLDTLNKKGGLSELAPIFKDLGLDGARASGVISVLAGKIDDVREAQATANAAFAEGNSVINEAAAVNGNAAAQLDKAKKAVQDAKAALGEELLPVITQLTQASAGGLRTAAAAVKFLTQHKGLVIGLGVAYGALHAAQKLVIAAQKEHVALSIKGTAVGNAYKSVVMLIAAAKARLAGSTAAATLAQKEFKAAFAATPWGAVIVAIGAVATGMGMLISKHRDARKAAEEFNTVVAKEQSEAQYLFEKLKKTEKGTDDYREALEKLKKKYPEIIQKHLDEEGALRDVEQAYKDVITQIQAKVAAQIKEEEITKATENGIKKQVKALAGFTEAQKATIRSMAQEGKTAEQIGSALGLSYYFTDFQGRQVKDDRFEALQKYVKAYEQMRKDVAAIDKKYDPYLQNSPGNRTPTLNSDDGSGSVPPPGSGSDPDQELQTKIAAFEKKLQEFRTRQQRETMDGWEKTKQAVIDSYQSMIDEASELKLTDRVKQLEEERAAAIAAAGQKYLEKNGKILEDFFQKFRDWQKESLPDSGNEILNAVLGTEQKWAQRFSEAQKQMQDLLDLRKLFVDDNIDTTAIDALIGKLEQSLNGMADLEAQDIRKTLEKYQKDIGDFITAEQKSVTDATLTETERQKNAIRERYELEIQLIEKLKAARKAADGEDADVSDLESQIEKLKKLLDQQLSNVDKAAASGQRSVWQQLTEFDWNKMSENWQSALNLMAQGLQEFANAAFDILSSISQMQADRDQAELDRFVAAQDEKSKALQRQLDDGLISQKYYNAQLLKMEREKEAKEKKMKHEQFERDRAASIAKALIEGGLAVAMAFSQYGWPWGLIPAALSTAQTAAQTAMIAAQVNPYAKGSYIRGPQLALMGEEGDEWVASNKLLRDKRTASIIEALDQYQKGNRSALAGITFAAPDPKSLSQAARANGGTFAPSNQTTNNYYQNTDNPELLYEIRMLRKYMEDPNNRRAYISRRMQLDFETNENELKELARL